MVYLLSPKKRLIHAVSITSELASRMLSTYSIIKISLAQTSHRIKVYNWGMFSCPISFSTFLEKHYSSQIYCSLLSIRILSEMTGQ